MSDYINKDGCCTNDEIVSSVLKSMPSQNAMALSSEFFKVLGDTTRIKILCALLARNLCVGDIAACINISQSAVSHQLRILRQSGLVKFEKEGKTVVYSLDDEHVEQIIATGLVHVSHKEGGGSNE